jgi:gliding motility-associated transport system permease protein
MSKAITEKTEAQTAPPQWGTGVEMAPSVLREDEPTVARTVGLIGACLVIFGGTALMVNAIGWNYRVGVGWGTLITVTGLVGLLWHAAFDPDLQVRRLYWGMGLAMLALGALLCVIPLRGGIGGLFGLGYPSFAVALLFLLATHRHETDAGIRQMTLYALGGGGMAMAVIAFLFSNNFWGEFLVPYGVLLALMGLAYLAAFATRQGTTTDLGHQVSVGIGVLGLIAFLIGALRSAIPWMIFQFGWVQIKPASYLVPWGLLFMGVGLLYGAISLGLWSDNRIVILTRRELTSFFYSPLAYIVLLALTFLGWWRFAEFISLLARPDVGPLFEPVVQYFVLSWWTVISVIFIIPALTMRLLSEEKRTGTLEVLLTAPVNESSVVISKFLACLVVFLLAWVPWGLFLVGLRIIGGKTFDYQALLSFFIVLTCTGAGFVAMGVFFSSLTRNQVISAILTFAGMLGLTFIYFIKRDLEPQSAWAAVITHTSYVELWFSSLQGVIIPRQLLFHISATILWLFLATKVLEARRWS